MDAEHQELLKEVQEAANNSIKKMKRRDKMKTQHRIKTLPHGYYYNPSVREMYRQMVASLECE